MKNRVFILALLIGIVSLLQDEVTYAFDKNSKTLVIKRKGIRGNRISSEPSSNVSEVQVEESATKNPQHDIWSIVAYLKNGVKPVKNEVPENVGPNGTRPDCSSLYQDLQPLPRFPGTNEIRPGRA